MVLSSVAKREMPTRNGFMAPLPTKYSLVLPLPAGEVIAQADGRRGVGRDDQPVDEGQSTLSRGVHGVCGPELYHFGSAAFQPPNRSGGFLAAD